MLYQDVLPKVSEHLPDWNLDYDRLKNIGKSIDQDEREVFPSPETVLRCLYFMKPSDVKVIILGQDCYNTPGVADGLSFSTKNESLPPSLRNIFKELKDDLGIDNNSGNLYPWKKQGVLLLNTYLTVAKGEPNSHSKIWEGFTQDILNLLLKKEESRVYILWGKFAKDCFYSCKEYIPFKENMIHTSAHPSPFSADKGFFGSKPFSKTNEYLISKNLESIDWST